MRILIVEDSPTDRELLRYLLEARFQTEAKFREANTLEEAIGYLNRGNTDCVILDLQLPDSTGRETFRQLNSKFPDIPIIVMTNNSDRDLALEMIQEGAADYVLKNYTDEEDIFRRVIFAVEKHRRTVKMTPDDANSFHRMERAKANMLTAHQSGQHSAIRDTTVETTSALADVSRKMVAELAQISVQQAQVVKTVEALDQELLRGHPGRPSMRSQMDLVHHRLDDVESDMGSLKGKIEVQEEARRKDDSQIKQAKMANWTKVMIAILTLIGVIVTSIVTYEVGKSKGEHGDSGQQK